MKSKSVRGGQKGGSRLPDCRWLTAAPPLAPHCRLACLVTFSIARRGQDKRLLSTGAAKASKLHSLTITIRTHTADSIFSPQIGYFCYCSVLLPAFLFAGPCCCTIQFFSVFTLVTRAILSDTHWHSLQFAQRQRTTQLVEQDIHLSPIELNFTRNIFIYHPFLCVSSAAINNIWLCTSSVSAAVSCPPIVDCSRTASNLPTLGFIQISKHFFCFSEKKQINL